MAFADCVNPPGWGKTYCSKYPGGGAVVFASRSVCGKGQCIVEPATGAWCSKMVGGGAAKRPGPSVKCPGGCERASKSMCMLVQ